MKRPLRSVRRVVHSVQSAFNRRSDLSAVVSVADPEAPLAEQVHWLENLMEWIRSTSRLPHDFDVSTGQLHWVRLRFLFQFLDRNPNWKRNVSLTLRSVLRQISGVELFCRTGLTQKGGMMSEIGDRLLKKVLPTPPQERNLDDIFPRIFRTENDALWIENLPVDVVKGVLALVLFESEGRPFENLRGSMLDALIVLGEEVAARGISPEMRNRLPFPSIHHSPFLALRRRLERMVATVRAAPGYSVDLCEEDLESCFGAIERIYQHLDQEGVSVHLVYQLEVQRAALTRIQTLLRLLSPRDAASHHRDITRFLGDLIRESLGARGIRLLLHNNLRLLSQKIVERAGASGEHYLARTPEEYRRMVVKGLGGGLVMIFTTLIKFAIGKARLAPFFEGIFASMNYAGSFVFMQLMGFTLATKQPAMTGPAIAGKLRQLRGSKDIRAFVDEVARLSRSNFAASFGNILAVFPGALLFGLGYYGITGTHVLALTRAENILDAHNPFTSLTIPFAIWTGILLWSAGITSGWVENWVVYRRLPEAIARHRLLVAAFGARRCEKASQWFLRQVGGLTGSISLGFLMGFTPILGRFFGLPLEVRHVTLVSASVGFAAASTIGSHFSWLDFTLACLAIVLVLLLNVGTSLGLAFTVACRAREVRTRSIFLLIRSTLEEFWRRPSVFFFQR